MTARAVRLRVRIASAVTTRPFGVGIPNTVGTAAIPFDLSRTRTCPNTGRASLANARNGCGGDRPFCRTGVPFRRVGRPECADPFGMSASCRPRSPGPIRSGAGRPNRRANNRNGLTMLSQGRPMRISAPLSKGTTGIRNP